MSQLEDIRLKQANHEKRISELEALVNPLASEMKEAASMKAAENLLDAPTDETPVNSPADLTPPPAVSPADEATLTLASTSTADVGEQSSVSESKEEEPKDEAN